MRIQASVLSLATIVLARGTPVAERSLVADGGWSLSMPAGSTCPGQTYTCFSNQTGVSEIFDRTGVAGTFDRGQECCPSGINPQLDCGTYVNNGQPYACCPLDNADCRGQVEDPSRKGDEKCANSGWALWQVPFEGYNMFCCLPGSYGYYDRSLGQDAVGQCQVSKDLPEGMTPAVQFDNGDGSVNSAGVQVSALPVATPSPAPVCDVIHYGWSLQVDDAAGCSKGSSLCSYGGACCPTGLNCGTTIGASEVPVCCPPDNPDCRGAVEGLWPQVCADSAWALWHVNTNGNHFCCLPGQVGFNVPNDNAAVGFCGSAVPNGTMRSILDYNGDNSTAGNFLSYPCDTNIPPNSTWGNITSSILHDTPHVPTGLPLATGLWGNGTIFPTAKTIYKPWEVTTYVCPSGSSETVAIIHSLSSGYPVSATRTIGVSGYTASPSVVGIVYTKTISGSIVVKTSTSSVAGYKAATSSGAGYNAATPSVVIVTYTTTIGGKPVVGTSTESLVQYSITPSEVNVIYTTTINGSPVVETTSSTAYGGGSASGSGSGSGGIGLPSSTLVPFTGGASNLGASAVAVGIGAVIAAVLLC